MAAPRPGSLTHRGNGRVGRPHSGQFGSTEPWPGANPDGTPFGPADSEHSEQTRLPRPVHLNALFQATKPNIPNSLRTAAVFNIVLYGLWVR
jgi:hypothetical protein